MKWTKWTLVLAVLAMLWCVAAKADGTNATNTTNATVAASPDTVADIVKVLADFGIHVSAAGIVQGLMVIFLGARVLLKYTSLGKTPLGAFISHLALNIPAKVPVILFMLASVVLVGTGCGTAHKTAKSVEDLTPAALVTAQGVGLPEVSVTNTVTASNSVSVVHIQYTWTSFTGTNGNPKPLLALDFSGAAGKSVALGRYHWGDLSKGAITAVLTDPHASAVSLTVQNQATLGGSHSFQTGDYTTVITTNAVNAITAGGSAAGNIIGAAAKAAAGTP